LIFKAYTARGIFFRGKSGKIFGGALGALKAAILAAYFVASYPFPHPCKTPQKGTSPKGLGASPCYLLRLKKPTSIYFARTDISPLKRCKCIRWLAKAFPLREKPKKAL
jgi:hypothetical protein